LSGFTLPFSLESVTSNSSLIVATFASLQALLALLVILGQRQLASALIVMTVVHTFVMYNPYYRNSTEIDRQRCYKTIISDLCMIATLFIVTDMKKAEK
jgi:hypothetical protein